MPWVGFGFECPRHTNFAIQGTFLPGPMLTERSRSSLSCASDIDSERDRTRFRERELAIEVKLLEDICNEASPKSSGEEDREAVAVSVSEKGEFGKTFDLINEHRSGRSDLNL